MTLQTLVNLALIVGGLATGVLAVVAVVFGRVTKRREGLASHQTQWNAHADRGEFRIVAALRSDTPISHTLFVDLVAPIPPKGHPFAVGRVPPGMHKYNVTAALLGEGAKVEKTTGRTIIDTNITEAIKSARAQLGLPVLSEAHDILTIGDSFAFVRDDHSVVWAHRID